MSNSDVMASTYHTNTEHKISDRPSSTEHNFSDSSVYQNGSLSIKHSPPPSPPPPPPSSSSSLNSYQNVSSSYQNGNSSSLSLPGSLQSFTDSSYQNDASRVTCRFCGKRFAQAGYVKAHERLHTGEKPFGCSICGKRFSDPSNWKKHEKVHFKNKTQSPTGSIPGPLVIGTGLGTCNIGGPVLTEQSLSANHHSLSHSFTNGHLHSPIKSSEENIQLHTPPLNLASNHVGLHHQHHHHPPLFSYKSPLFSLANAHARKLKSDAILGSFGHHHSSSSLLSSFSQSSLNQLICKICGKHFSSQSSLAIHRRIHTGERPHRCSQCGKSFTQIGTLRTHERVHSGERPYQCQICGKTFSQSGSYRIHEKRHVLDYVHRCRFCFTEFPTLPDLEIHLNTVHAQDEEPDSDSEEQNIASSVGSYPPSAYLQLFRSPPSMMHNQSAYLDQEHMISRRISIEDMNGNAMEEEQRMSDFVNGGNSRHPQHHQHTIQGHNLSPQGNNYPPVHQNGPLMVPAHSTVDYAPPYVSVPSTLLTLGSRDHIKSPASSPEATHLVTTTTANGYPRKLSTESLPASHVSANGQDMPCDLSSHLSRHEMENGIPGTPPLRDGGNTPSEHSSMDSQNSLEPADLSMRNMDTNMDSGNESPKSFTIRQQNLNTRMMMYHTAGMASSSANSRKQKHPTRRFNVTDPSNGNNIVNGHMNGNNNNNNNKNNNHNTDLDSPLSGSLTITTTVATPPHDYKDNDDDAVISYLISKGTIYKCQHCKILFEDCTLYLLHNGFHSHDGEPFRCVICRILCKDRFDFNCHLTSHIK